MKLSKTALHILIAVILAVVVIAILFLTGVLGKTARITYEAFKKLSPEQQTETFGHYGITAPLGGR